MRPTNHPTFSACLASIIVLGLSLGAGAQTWTEQGDAGDTLSLAQTTRGPGALTQIVGSTVGVDERDAYCIKVTDPANFSASTSNAGTDFDTRLLLFGRHDVALLANDDVSANDTKSLLTATATDGSLYELERAGEFVLMVTGFGEDPTDAAAVSLFDFPSDLTWVHAVDSSAGRIRDWQGDGATGNYQIDLVGAEACTYRPELVVSQVDIPTDLNQICSGTDGVYEDCREFDQPLVSFATQVGYFNDDPHLDTAFGDLFGSQTRICLGDGGGGLGGCFEGPAVSPEEIQVADMNGDQIDDLILSRFAGGQIQICTGDGSGDFPFCSPLSSGGSGRVAIGYVDADPHLDVVGVVGSQIARYCLGDGNGGLELINGFDCTWFEVYPGLPSDTPSLMDVAYVDLDNNGDFEGLFVGEDHPYVCTGIATDQLSCLRVLAATGPVRDTRSVATADLDADGDLDAVFGNNGVDRVCLGNGSIGFSACADLDSDDSLTQEVLLEDINGDGHVDAVLSKATGISTCPGNGNGTFQPCVAKTLSTSERLSRLVIAELGQPLFTDDFESGDLTAWN